jgi:hypothetical protein
VTEAAEQKPAFEGWVILELMGHRRLAGYLSEATIGGTSFLRIDVPGNDGNVATQLYSGSAVYCITPTTEAIARTVAKGSEPAPVTRWELREERALKLSSAPYSEAELHGAGESDDEELAHHPV